MHKALTISKGEVSIYPKAEMGLREKFSKVLRENISSFNLPEGRDGFKSNEAWQKLLANNPCFNLPEGRDGFKRKVLLRVQQNIYLVSIYPKAEMGLRGFTFGRSCCNWT